MHHIAILGSTGSIGTQTLKVIDTNRKKFSITILSAFQNDKLLEQQIEKYQPKMAVLIDNAASERLFKRYNGTTKLFSGEEGLLEALEKDNKSQTVFIAIVGFSGVKPTLIAIKAGKRIALANKETLVAAGEIISKAIKKYNVEILPIDSEHSAIFQCIQGESKNHIGKLILTASGGPFFGYTKKQLKKVNLTQCLKHPNWSMGKKNTVDSATLVNKGLEIIEARWLFDILYNKIKVVIHPQSIIHSFVEFIDGSIMAQASLPDMRFSIHYALFYPIRKISKFSKLDFSKIINFNFFPPDLINFPALNLAYKVGIKGGTMPAVFSAANEVAVDAFLAQKIPFIYIVEIIKQCIHAHSIVLHPTLKDIIDADLWARNYAINLIN